MNLYIDESGSINATRNKNFIISVVIPTDTKKLSKVHKRFVSKYMDRLKELDENNKMFTEDGDFKELKGSCFDKEMKLNFLNYFCRNDLLKIRYIILNNEKLDSRFTKNKARTFNYLMKLFLTNTINKKIIKSENIFLQIDERNVKTDSKFSLEDYLNQELVLHSNLVKDVKVEYFDSSNNRLIQIADVFSNIRYSDIVTGGAYKGIIMKLKSEKYILSDFKFPEESFFKKS